MKKTSNEVYSKKRKHIRFKPSEAYACFVEFSPAGGKFKPDVCALALEESYGGCCLLIVIESEFGMKDMEIVWRVRVGELSPLYAEVAWIRNLDVNIYKVGLKYLPGPFRPPTVKKDC